MELRKKHTVTETAGRSAAGASTGPASSWASTGPASSWARGAVASSPNRLRGAPCNHVLWVGPLWVGPFLLETRLVYEFSKDFEPIFGGFEEPKLRPKLVFRIFFAMLFSSAFWN